MKKESGMEKSGNQYLEDMKQEYKNIMVPSELKNKVEESIMEGKKRNKTKRIIQFTRVGASTAAAALFAMVVLTNSNQSISYAMKKMPVIGVIADAVTFRTYVDKTNHFEANIEVPQIDIENQEEHIKQAAEELNRSVEEYTNILIEQYNADMKASEGEGNYAVDTSYQVIDDGDRFFSLRIDTVVAMGGSNSFSKFYHIDKESGTVITLKDLFKEDADYIGMISENIKAQMKEQMAADESITYFYDNEETEEWNFEEIDEEQNFYIKENEALIIVFDKYEVAPGYMGIIEFAIPLEVLENSMK